jgi:hypothetical protein
VGEVSQSLQGWFPGVFHSVEGFVVSFYSGGNYFIFGESRVDCFEPPGLDFLVGVYVFPSVLALQLVDFGGCDCSFILAISPSSNLAGLADLFPYGGGESWHAWVMLASGLIVVAVVFVDAWISGGGFRLRLKLSFLS